MKLKQRIEALEKEFTSEPILLQMPDGSIETITGSGDHLLRLFEVAAGGRDISHEQAAQLEMIRQCTGSKEPGDAHLVDVIRCFLFGPEKAGSQAGGLGCPA
jgi:hypothetical protein